MLDTDRLPADITGLVFTKDHQFAYIRKANVFLYELQSYKQIEKLPLSRYATVLTSQVTDRAWMVTPAASRTRFTVFTQGSDYKETSTCIVPVECDNPNCCSDELDNFFVSSKDAIFCWWAKNSEPQKIYQSDEDQLINSLCCMNGHVYAAISTAIPAIKQYTAAERIFIWDYCIKDRTFNLISLSSVLRQPQMESYSYACIHCSKSGFVLVLHLRDKRTVLHLLDQQMHEKDIPPFVIDGKSYFQHFSPDGSIFALDSDDLIYSAGKHSLKKSLFTVNLITNQIRRFDIDTRYYWGWGFSDTSDQVLIYNAGKPIPICIQ